MTGAAGSNPGNITFGGQRWPDIVGALHVKQGWGEAQISGVIHDVNANGFQGAAGVPAALGGTGGCSLAAVAVLGTPVVCDSQHTQTGSGIDAGVKFNLNWWGAGDSILFTGSYTENAVWYSGLPDGMWGENGQVNGNGQPMYLADAFFNPLTNSWSKPTAWSVTGIFEHHFTPQFYVDLEGSVGGIEWSNMGGGCNFSLPGCLAAQAVQGPLSKSATSWIIGADLGWNPVNNLNFDLELMYQDTNQQKPSGFLGTVYNIGGAGGAIFVPGAWEGNSSGFAGRFRITRYF
jgi:Porin subfamily